MTRESAAAAALEVQLFLKELEAGALPRSALVEVLQTLPASRRHAWSSLLGGCGGAWVLFATAAPRAALYCGDALSTDVLALALWGWNVTVLEVSHERLVLARRLRGAAGQPHGVCSAHDTPLPFADASFDLVVAADAAPDVPLLDELRRVTRDELVLLLDEGRAAPARVRARLRAHDLAPARTAGLLPGAGNLEQLIALDRSRPRTAVPPGNRRLRLVALARRLGLRDRAAPAQALFLSTRGGASGASHIERALARLAEELDEPCPELEHVLASCGGTLEVLTAPTPGSDAGVPTTAGCWRLHLPTRPEHAPALERGQRLLELVRARLPGFPVPQPLARGSFAGLPLVAERRLPGWPLDARRGWEATADRVLQQACEDLAQLRTRPPAALQGSELEAWIEAWRVQAGLPLEALRERRLARLLDGARERLHGAPLPRVLRHGDLRPRHVQVARGGEVLGYVHWSLGEEYGAPGLDPLHLLVHLRAPTGGGSLGAALTAMLQPERLRVAERTALEGYAARLELAPGVLEGLARLYPLHAASIAGRFSPASDPRWLARQLEALDPTALRT